MSAAFCDSSGSEIDSNILYASGEDRHVSVHVFVPQAHQSHSLPLQGNPTYTPRAVVLDFAGSEGLQRALIGSAATSLAREGLSSRTGAQASAGGYAAAGDDAGGEDAETEDQIRLVEQLAASQLPDNPFFSLLQRSENDAALNSAEELERLALDLDQLVTSWGDYGKTRFSKASLLGIGARSATGDGIGSSLAATGLSHRAGSGNSAVSCFDAFSYGSEYWTDSIEEAVRLQLEACDSIQGIQAIVDIDGGFGSLAVETLCYLREECPRAPMIVMGAMPPRPRASFGVGGNTSMSTVPGPSDYAVKDRNTMRDINTGLAFAQFASRGGPADLDCLFVPLSLQPYAEALAEAVRAAHGMYDAAQLTGAAVDAVAGTAGTAAVFFNAWLPGLKRLVATRHYQTSAVLAAAVDTMTMPMRRNVARGDQALPFCRDEADALRKEQSATGSGVLTGSGRGRAGELEGSDARTRSGARNAADSTPTLLFDPSLEHSPAPPVVGLSPGLGMKEFVGLHTPAPHLRVACLSLAMPTPHPRASATVLDKVLAQTDPLHACRLDTFTPLSWVASGALPRRMYGEAAERAVRDSTDSMSRALQGRTGGGEGGEEEEGKPAPFAHSLTVRGIGTHNIDTSCRYGSTLHAYGRVLDRYMGRTACNTAGHAVFRTPLPLPITFPRLLPGSMYDYAGAYVGGGGSASALAGRPPTVPLEASLAVALQQASAGGALPGSHVPWPFSLPVMTHLANTPAYGPCLQRIHAAFMSRDQSVTHRYTAADRTSSRSALELEEAQALLASLVDDYTAGGQ